MRRSRLIAIVRSRCHPALPLVAALFLAPATFFSAQACLEARARLAADDPVQITDQALDHVLTAQVAEREINAALAAGDADLAESFVALAADRGLPIEPSLVEKVKSARAEEASFSGTAGRFVHGLWTGEPVDLASLAGTAFGDLFVFGDVRDAAREGTRYLQGQSYDPWILGLAGAGLAITAGTYATLGAAAPERIGLSLVKAARRTGRLNPALTVRAARELVKVEGAGGLIELAENSGRIEAKAGTRAALDSLAVAEEPQDVSRLAHLAAAKGGKTRAIVKLLGRAAIVLTAGALEFTQWLLWAALMALGFCASCKATVERMTLRYVRWRKAMRANAATPRVVSP